MKKNMINEVLAEKAISEEFEWSLTDEGYFIVKLLEYVVLRLDDRAIQRLLRDVDNNELAVALKGLSLNAQNAFLHNLSPRLATMIREDMVFMGPVLTSSCAEHANGIMIKAVRLMSTGEIADPDSDIIRLMMNLFRVDSEKLTKQEAVSVESNLEALFRKYKSIHRRVIP